MPKNIKHTDKIRKEFRRFLANRGGIIETRWSKKGIKDVYILGDIQCVYVWHSSPSCNKIVQYSISDVNGVAKKLGIYEEWSSYSNENTVYMHSGLIGDMFK